MHFLRFIRRILGCSFWYGMAGLWGNDGLAQGIEVLEGQAFRVGEKEFRVIEVWVHQHKPYVSIVFENEEDTVLLTYGEKMPFVPFDLYLEDLTKIGQQPAKIVFSPHPKEKTFNVLPEMTLKASKLYDVNGILVSFNPQKDWFEFELNERYRLKLKLKGIIWLGQNAFLLAKYQDWKKELTLVRLTELLFYKGDTLYRLAEEVPAAQQAFVEQIVMLPKPVPKNPEDLSAEDYQICLVRVYLEPIAFQAPRDRFIVQGKANDYPYTIVKVFRNKQEALDYAYKHKIQDVFID